MKNIAMRLVAVFALAGFLLPAIPAAAQVGASVQIYWNNNQPYYYDQNHHRHYMSVNQAQVWYQRHDPTYWRRHQREWQQGHYSQWNQQWRSYHHNQNQNLGGQ